MMLTDTPKTEGRDWLPREQELTVGLSWVLTMGAFRCGWLVVVWRAVWQSGPFPFTPFSLHLLISAYRQQSATYLII